MLRSDETEILACGEGRRVTARRCEGCLADTGMNLCLPWAGPRCALLLHSSLSSLWSEGLGGSVIVTGSGTELQFMAGEGFQLGRKGDWQQNSFTYMQAKSVLQIVFAGQCVLLWHLLLHAGCCMLAL